MSTTFLEAPSTTNRRASALRLTRKNILVWSGLAAIVALAAALRFGNIEAIGQSNTYYTAAVESMLQSWRNFFFVAAEPGGSVSIDKPPVGLWIEAISAYFLGVNGFATVLPQLLAGIFSVILLFHLVRRSFGNVAGLLAALALAITPVAIAVERNNTSDGTLIFTLLLAAWAFIKATETHRLRFLMLGAVLVGIGFNIKMMQAFLPLPALYALYFLSSEQGWWRKIVHLGLATLALVAVSLSWAVVVDLTPADQRPYVGSSENNSVLNLMLGYNGIDRLTGMNPGGATSNVGPRADGQFTPPVMPNGQENPPALSGQGGDGQPPADGNRLDDGGPGSVGGMFGTGQAGILRMFQSGLAAQASWLLPFGLIMLVAMALSVSWRRPQAELHRGLILWGGWLITCLVFFSVAGFFHQYYLAMLGAPLAALVAMGVTFLWRLRTAHPIRTALLLLVAAGVTLAFQVYAVSIYQSLDWWIAVPIVLGIMGLGLLIAGVWRNGRMLLRVSFVLVMVALLVIPAIWSGLTTAYASVQGPMPQAYSGKGGSPALAGPGNIAQGTAGGGQGVNQSLLDYLQANTRDTKYLMVVPSSQAGASYVLATGRPVLYAGGFNGSDSVIDGDDLAGLVASGEVRYVLWGGGSSGSINSSIAGYLQSSCTVVADSSLGLSASTQQSADGQPGFASGRNNQSTLYQCGSWAVSGNG